MLVFARSLGGGSGRLSKDPTNDVTSSRCETTGTGVKGPVTAPNLASLYHARGKLTIQPGLELKVMR